MRRFFVCAVAGALVAAGCSGSGGEKSSSTTQGSSSSASTAVATGTPGFQLSANRSTVVSAGSPAHLSGPITKASEGLVRDYIKRATVDVLRTGRLGKGFSDLFGSDAVAVLARAGNDRTTVTDLGYARGSGAVKVLGKMHLTGLADSNGNIVMVSASIKAAVRRGALAIDRSGELLLARGDGGHWKIVGYNLRARRATAGAPATTTTAARTPSASNTGGKP